MRALARVLIRVFFRRVELEGSLPASGPTLLIANHQNGLVDGLLLMATLPRYPRFMGKSTLFKIPLLWPFLKLGRVVPIHRAADGGAGARNDAAFRTARRVLGGGGLLAIFPEGISHDEASVQPLRTGAARIALGAAFDDKTENVTVVPVGLIYDAKARFRSRALVRVGPARPVVAWGSSSPDAVRSLTSAMADWLSEVSPSYESVAEEARLARIAAVATGGSDLATQERLARSLAVDMPPGLGEAFDAYERDLTLLGITDRQLVGTHRARLAVAVAVARVIAALPFAAVGLVVHVVPYRIMKVVGRLPSNEGIKATVKLLGCFFLFTAEYAALAAVVGTRWGVPAGMAAFVAAPVCGYATVRLTERVYRIGGLLVGYRVVRSRSAAVGSVLARRASVVALATAALSGCRASACNATTTGAPDPPAVSPDR